MTPERLAAFRKTFAGMSSEELKAIAEGRKKTNLSEESLAAIRLLLAERKGGGVVAVLSPDSHKSAAQTGHSAALPASGHPAATGAAPQAPRTTRLVLALGICGLLVALAVFVARRPGGFAGLLENKNEKVAGIMDGCVQDLQSMRNDFFGEATTNELVLALKQNVAVGATGVISTSGEPWRSMQYDNLMMQLRLAESTVHLGIMKTVGGANRSICVVVGGIDENGSALVNNVGQAILPKEWEFLGIRVNRILSTFVDDQKARRSAIERLCEESRKSEKYSGAGPLEKHLEENLEKHLLDPVDSLIRSYSDLRDKIRRGDAQDK